MCGQWLALKVALRLQADDKMGKEEIKKLI